VVSLSLHVPRVQSRRVEATHDGNRKSLGHSHMSVCSTVWRLLAWSYETVCKSTQSSPCQEVVPNSQQSSHCHDVTNVSRRQPAVAGSGCRCQAGFSPVRGRTLASNAVGQSGGKSEFTAAGPAALALGTMSSAGSMPTGRQAQPAAASIERHSTRRGTVRSCETSAGRAAAASPDPRRHAGTPSGTGLY
jgi:hypothetical protein